MHTLFHFSSSRRDTASARKGDFVQSQIGFLLPQADFTRPKAGFHWGLPHTRQPPIFTYIASKTPGQ